MIILSIDPGSEKSAWLIYNSETKSPTKFGIDENAKLMRSLPSADEMVIEMVASYGMAVGKSVFETCVWTGRFMQEWLAEQGKEAIKIYRHEVKTHLCNSMRAKDSNIRRVLLDKLGKETTKGIKSHLWSALALAIVWSELNEKGNSRSKRFMGRASRKTQNNRI